MSEGRALAARGSFSLRQAPLRTLISLSPFHAYSLLAKMPAVTVDPLLPPQPTSMRLKEREMRET